MTADAKVGLLLGLFFIVVIAFLVNGLPNFIHQENPSPPGAAIITPTGPDMPLDDRVSDAVHRLYKPRAEARTEEPDPIEIVLETSRDIPGQIETPDIVVPPQTHSPIENNIPAVVVKTPVPVRTHVVKSGESLAVVAQTYYGKDQGNRLAVIHKLYEANSDVLKSPDRVDVGDKLVIPSLDDLLKENLVVKAPDPSKTLLSKFTNLLEPVGNVSSRTVSEYVVQEGDNLWAIAQAKLGDGKRYEEILQLNKDIIKSADDVTIGMHLKLPPK